MGKVNIYPNSLKNFKGAQDFINKFLTSEGKLKAQAIRHIPLNLIEELFYFGKEQGLISDNLPENILWIHKAYTEYPKVCSCGKSITDFESFNQEYKSDYCSYSCTSNSSVVQDKKKKTNLENHGTEWGFQSEVIQNKSRTTLLSTRGVRHNMHDVKVLEANQRHRTYHHILESGTEITYQGYELIAILELLKTYSEDEIILNGIPNFWYQNKIRSKYYPDIYIPSKRLIIEVKSKYTYKKDFDKNQLKRQAVLDDGFNFQFWICSKKELLYIL